MSSPEGIIIDWDASRLRVGNFLRILGETSGVHNVMIIHSITRLGDRTDNSFNLFPCQFLINLAELELPKNTKSLDDQQPELENGDKSVEVEEEVQSEPEEDKQIFDFESQTTRVEMKLVVFLTKIKAMLDEFEDDFRESTNYDDKKDVRHCKSAEARKLLSAIAMNTDSALIKLALQKQADSTYRITHTSYKSGA